MGISVEASPETSSPFHHPSLDFAPAHPESVSSYLAPGCHFFSQQGPSTGDSAGPVYAWSNPSTVDLLRPSASPMEPAASVTAPVPFKKSYHDHGTLQPQLHDTSVGLYSDIAPSSDMSSLLFSAAEMPSSIYIAFDENLDSLAEQLLSPPQSMDSLTSHTAGLASEIFLSPTSAPAGSVDTFSIPRNSPPSIRLFRQRIFPF